MSCNESHWNINISQHGHYHFRVRICNRLRVEKIYPELCEKYKKVDGYEIDVTYWDITGHNVNSEFQKGV